MFEQRPMEVLASHLVAMVLGALLYAGVQVYANAKVKTALRDKESKNGT